MTARLLIVLIRVYQVLLSPIVGGGCRFLPSCSEYAIQAIRAHGTRRGSWLAARRIGRCHPFGGHGHDPVPPRKDPPGRRGTLARAAAEFRP
jgi:uncharacterized protein